MLTCKEVREMGKKGEEMILKCDIFDDCIVIDIECLNKEIINNIIDIVTPKAKTVTDRHNNCVVRTLCITSNSLYDILIELTMHFEIMLT